MAEPTTSAEMRAKDAPYPVDPNVRIPRHVLDAAARAEAIQQAVNGEAEPSLVAQVDPNAPIKIEAQPEAPKTMTVQQAPPVMPQPQAPNQPNPQEPNQLTPADWERNFYAMKGRYDKQGADMAAMGETLSRVQAELQNMRQVGIPMTPAPQSRTVNLLTPEEIQEYGPEFIDVVRRAAGELTAPLQEEVELLRGQLGTVRQETGNSFLTRMNATISGLVPNWEAVNRDPSFVQWTSLPDIFSGVRRGELMQQAWDSGDARRVASFLQAFLAEEAAVDPQASAQRGRAGFPAALAPPVPSPPQLSLEALAAPGRAHSVAQQPTDKPVYSAADITRFYTDVAAGRWRMREPERAAIDADIIAAQREGRIIPDQRTARPMNTFNGGR